MHLTAIATRYY